MVYELPSEYVKAFLILNNTLKKTVIVVPDVEKENEHVSLSLRKNRNTIIKVNIDDSTPNIKIDVYLEAHLESISSTTDYFKKEYSEMLKKETEENVKALIEDYMSILIQNKSDINGFGRYARLNFKTWDEFEEFNWKNKFGESTFEINVDVDIDVSSIIFHSLPNK